MKNNKIYACLSIKDFSLTLFTTKNQVADMVKCHRNSLIDMKDRITFGDYIIIETSISRCKRGRR